MKKFFDISSICFAIIFIVAIISYVIKIYSLPGEIFENLADNRLIAEVYLVFGFGLISIVFTLVSNKTNAGKEVVYVDRISKTNKAQNTKSGAGDHTEAVQQKISVLKQLIQSEKSSSKKEDKILSLLCDQIKAGQAILYKRELNETLLRPVSSFAYVKDRSEDLSFDIGDGLPGLAAKEGKMMILDNIPEGYFNIVSGLGHASPEALMILPLKNDNAVVGILEAALFHKPGEKDEEYFKKLSEELGKMLVS